jgi:hypothetical protein
MALGKEIGSFSFKLTSVSYAGPEGSAQLNVDGKADRYGTVLGTLVLSGAPGAKNGSASWRGEGFLENGEVVAGTGEGSWQEIGKHKWRTRMIIRVSDGEIFASDGQLDLASRSYTGKNLEWS